MTAALFALAIALTELLAPHTAHEGDVARHGLYIAAVPCTDGGAAHAGLWHAQGQQRDKLHRHQLQLRWPGAPSFPSFKSPLCL